MSSDSRHFVTVATFTLPTDIVVAKGVLENAGIEHFVHNELTVQTHNLLSNAIGGVRLQVAEGDYEKAKMLLIEGELIKDEPLDPSPAEKILHSKGLQKRAISWIILLAAIITLFMVFLIS